MKKGRGFTLIELLVVIVIIGILATLSMLAYQSYAQKGRDAKRMADIDGIKKALSLYYQENNKYPVCTATPPDDPVGCSDELGHYVTEANMPSNFLVYLNPLPRNPIGSGNQKNQGYGYVVTQAWDNSQHYGLLVNYEVEGTKACTKGSYAAGDSRFCYCKTGDIYNPSTNGWWGNTVPICQ